MRSAPASTPYSFGTFIADSGSHEALAASRAVAENPRFEHNPVLLYGPTGSGKTHLLHAIADVMRRNRKVLHVTSEVFVRRLIDSIKSDELATFRRSLRDVDALLLDDLEVVQTPRRRTRAEVIRLLAEVADSGVQLVVASRLRREFAARVEKRLRQRFPKALVVAVE